MKLHLTPAEGNNLISGYGPGWVEVNLARHTSSLIVLPAMLVTAWPAASFYGLTNAHFESIAKLKPEVVLLGTGGKPHFPHPRLYQSLLEMGVGMECMSTGAACRTYNILAAEGRHVAAALIL